MKKNDLITRSFRNEYCDRFLYQISCDVKQESKFCKALENYIVACNVSSEPDNVIHNSVYVCMIGKRLIILKEDWFAWRFFPTPDVMKEGLKSEQAKSKKANESINTPASTPKGTPKEPDGELTEQMKAQ